MSAASRWGQVIDLLEAAYGIDATVALCEHLLFAGGGGGAAGGGAAAECNDAAAAAPEQREAKLREATLKCAPAANLPAERRTLKP